MGHVQWMAGRRAPAAACDGAYAVDGREKVSAAVYNGACAVYGREENACHRNEGAVLLLRPDWDVSSC